MLFYVEKESHHHEWCYLRDMILLMASQYLQTTTVERVLKWSVEFSPSPSTKCNFYSNTENYYFQ